MTDTVVHDAENHRYLLMRGDEQLGEEVYELGDGSIRFVHTLVPDIGEKGLGAKLVAGALDDVRATATHKVVPVCPYVKHFFSTHEQYQDLLASPLDS